MKTPYEILGIATNADDNKIKQAYLLKVKDNPPDREQEQFQIIRDAYESIKDKKSRISYDLFTLPIANFDKLIDQALEPQEKVTFNAELFNKLLSVCIDDSTIEIEIPTP
jgi:curved DNA-binding protein CbpA